MGSVWSTAQIVMISISCDDDSGDDDYGRGDDDYDDNGCSWWWKWCWLFRWLHRLEWFLVAVALWVNSCESMLWLIVSMVCSTFCYYLFFKSKLHLI